MESAKHILRISIIFFLKLLPLILVLLLAKKLHDTAKISQEQMTVGHETHSQYNPNMSRPNISIFHPKGSVIEYSNSKAEPKGGISMFAMTWIAQSLIFIILVLMVPTAVTAAPAYSTEQLNKLRVIHVMNTVAQRVLFKAYKFIKDKNYDDSINIKEHLLSTNVGWTQEQYETNFDLNMRNIIETTDASGEHYDISLLIKCIKTLSLEHDNKYHKRWNVDGQLEIRCQYLVNKRNTIFHTFGGITCIELKNEIAEIELLLKNILTSLVNRFPTEKSDISDLEKEVLDKLSYFLTHQLDQTQIDMLSQFAKLDLNDEIKQYKIKMVKKFGRIKILDFLVTSNLFHNITKLYTEVVIKQSMTKVECIDILDRLTASPSTILLLESVAGGGKSTLCIGTMNDWGTGNNKMKTDSFYLLIPMLFRDPVTRSLKDLINQLFPKSREDIIKHFSDPNCKILFICDGFDESNENSMNLLNEILELKRNNDNINMLITSRPESVRELYSKRGSDLNIDHLLIEGIHYDKRCEFIEKYFKAIADAKGYTESVDELLEFYTQLSDRVKELYKLPMNMVILVWIYIEDKLKALTIKSSAALYASILEISHQKLLARLSHSYPDVMKNVNKDITKLDKLINKFTAVLYRESLVAIRNSHVYIDEESADRLREICEEIKIPFLELTATYLLSKLEWMTYLRETLEFPHKGIMEFYAAKCIEFMLSKGDKGKSIKMILLDLYDNKRQFKIQDYDNVLRLLGGILAMNKPKLLDEHGPEIIQLLAEYGNKKDMSRWIEVYSDFNVNTTAAHKFALLIAPHLILKGFKIKNSDLEILTTLFEYIDVNDVKFEIRGPETPTFLSNLVDMLRQKGCPMVIDNITDDEISLWTSIIKPGDKIKISKFHLTKKYGVLPLLSHCIITEELTLTQCWREPCDTTHLMKDWPLIRLKTSIADINVVPTTLKMLSIGLFPDADGRAVDPGLGLLMDRCLGLECLCVHVSGMVDAQHLQSLPDVQNTHLFLSQVSDTNLDSARDTIIKLHPQKGYGCLFFPQCSVSSGAKLGVALRAMASAGVKVTYFVTVSGPHSDQDELDFKTAATAAFPGCDPRWHDDEKKFSDLGW